MDNNDFTNSGMSDEDIPLGDKFLFDDLNNFDFTKNGFP